jgi:hypothetical protein
MSPFTISRQSPLGLSGSCRRRGGRDPQRTAFRHKTGFRILHVGDVDACPFLKRPRFQQLDVIFERRESMIECPLDGVGNGIRREFADADFVRD